MKRRGKMAVQKMMGAALLIVAICGFMTAANIAAIACAMALGLAFLFSRKVIFEI